MYKCEICGKEFKTSKGLSLHITRTEKLDRSKYYDKYIGIKEGEGFCLTCGKPTKFENFDIGYLKFCCVQCVNRCDITQEKRKQTCLTKYGVDSPRKTEEVKAKAKKTNLERYGVENPSQSEEIKEKNKQTCLERYGVVSTLQLEEVKEKIKQTMIERYGVENPSQSEEVKEKVKKTWLKNYGVDNPSKSSLVKETRKINNMRIYGKEHTFQVDSIKNKCKNTLHDNFGVVHPSQSPKIRETIIQTMLDRHGVENPSQLEIVKEKKKKLSLQKWGVEFPIQHHEIKQRAKEGNLSKYGVECISQLDYYRKNISVLARIRMIKRIFNSDRLKEKCTPNFNENEYINVEHRHSWTCTKCQTIFDDHLNDGKIPRCPTCYPKLAGTSKPEKEVAEFVESLGIQIELNSRQVIPPKELDIYIPSHNLAIEFNGLYWHSELNGTDKNYHLNKTQLCLEKGIQLLHIFEDEWINQQEIVKSMIRAKLGVNPTKIYARKCTIQSVPSDDAQLFLFDNHLQGSINGHHIGLYHNTNLVAILTYAKPRFNKKYDYEVLRFCNKVNTSVVGGLSKLIAHLKKLNPAKTIISYADRRYGEGNGYLQCGFTMVNSSGPSFFYIKDYIRQNRMRFQKHLLEDKLESFDPILTEWENMQLNDYDRIWDCGCNVYVTK